MASKKGQVLSEDELRQLSENLKAKEARLQMQSEALRKQQEEYDARLSGQTDKTAKDLTDELIALRTQCRRLEEWQRDIVLGTQNINQNQSTITSNMNQSPAISLKSATEFVPTFDGHNIPVLQFARACRRAKDTLPPHSEANLVRLLRNRLQGQAYQAVEDETHHTVSDVINILRHVLAPSKSINHYREELSNIYRKPNETILTYISRVKDLRTTILEGMKREQDAVTQDKISTVGNEALLGFCDGLPLDFQTQLKLEGYHTLTEAFSKAIIIEKKREKDQERYRTGRFPKRNPPQVNNSTQGAAKCQICHRKGHDTNQCWYNETNRPRYNANQQINRPPDRRS